MKKLLASVFGLALVASVALAQTYDVTGSKDSFTVARGYISASTPVGNQEIFSNDQDVYVSYRCGTAVSLTILNKLSDGTVLNSQSVACDTTARVTSFAAPTYFEAIAVSATTAVSTTAGGVSTTIIQTKAE